jgi:C-terminal processing protease CtpA/Prc
MRLNPQSRSEVLRSIRSLVLKHHINVGGVSYEEWGRLLAERTPELLGVDDPAFEDGVRELLGKLGSSHTAFYHVRQNRLLPQHTVGATLRSISLNGNARWMFLDVFEDGPAHVAGISPGEILLALDEKECVPPSMPSFQVGHGHRLTVHGARKDDTRNVAIAVPAVKGTKQRPPLVEPKSVVHRILAPGIGFVRVTYFPGAFGLRFGTTLDSAIARLKQQGCDRLIIDLRGSIGGSLGFARLASYMCPGEIAIGHSLTRKLLGTGYDRDRLPRARMPSGRVELLLTLARFAVRDKSVVLLTQGLGQQPFHNRIAVLVNEWTNSAAEMAAAFAAENRLATLVGNRTAGNVLGAANFGVGHDYWVRLPIFGWYTSLGRCLEGQGVCPDVLVDVSSERLGAGQDDQLAKAIEIVTAI